MYRLGTAVLFVVLWITLADGGVLHTKSSTKEVLIGGSITLACDAEIFAGDQLLFLVGPDVYGLVVSSAVVDDAEFFKLQETAQLDAFMRPVAGNPPRRNVTLKLTLTGITPSDAKEYKCQMSGKAATHTLLIHGPPYNITFTSDSKNVTLSRVTTWDRNSYPGIAQLWNVVVVIDYNEPIRIDGWATSQPAAELKCIGDSDEQHLGGALISIEKRSDDIDDSLYRCTARNSYGDIVAAVKVTTHYKPRLVSIKLANAYPLKGDEILQKCEFDARPAAVVNYYKVDSRTKEWTRIEPRSDGIMDLGSFDPAVHVGEYACVGISKVGSTTRMFNIYGKPKDVKIAADKVYGDSLALILEAYSSSMVKLEVTLESLNADGNTRIVDKHSKVSSEVSIPWIITNLHVPDLQPLTAYSVSLLAINGYGKAESMSITITTASDGVAGPPNPPPDHIDSPEVLLNVDKPDSGAVTRSPGLIMAALCSIAAAVLMQ